MIMFKFVCRHGEDPPEGALPYLEKLSQMSPLLERMATCWRDFDDFLVISGTAGVLDSQQDQPAVRTKTGAAWFLDGVPHRRGAPAVTLSSHLETPDARMPGAPAIYWTSCEHWDRGEFGYRETRGERYEDNYIWHELEDREGALHCETGPASTHTNYFGERVCRYFIHGREQCRNGFASGESSSSPRTIPRKYSD